jgi:beta-lactamase superfamily II metal-dependent hydrolase
MANMVIYKVQVGAYLLKLNANNVLKKLKKKGFNPIIVKSGKLYKVQVGAYSKIENAQNIQKKLKNFGFKSIIVEYLVKQEEPTVPEKKESVVEHPRIRIWGIWFTETCEEKYGDATAIIQYDKDDNIEHAILIDTGMNGCDTINKLKKAGVKKIDAVVISHAHGDHYGFLTAVFDNFEVGALYLPDCTELDKYQKSNGNSIRNQENKAKKRGIDCTYLKKGSSFEIGKIKCDCIWQASANQLHEHDDHHFVNNMSVVLVFTLDGIWKYHTAGDLQNEANNLLCKEIADLKADVFKVQWHGDANACNNTICKAVSPKIAFWNYHHKEQSGRGTTRKRLESVGAIVARNYENGDIYIDCIGNTMTLSSSKKNISATFKK